MIYVPSPGNELIFHMDQFSPNLMVSNYVGKFGSYTSKVDFFIGMRTHLAGINGVGWEIIDSFYNNNESVPEIDDWYVIKGTAFTGLTTYFKIIYQNTSYLTIISARFWNPTTHSGVDLFYSGVGHIPLADTSDLHIYGDITSIAIITEISGVKSLFLFGVTENTPYDPTVRKTDQQITTSGVQILRTDINSELFIDDEVYVFDNDNIEICQVNGLNSTLKEITLTTTHTYPQGCSVSADLCAYIQTSSDLTTVDNFRGMIGSNGGKNIALNWDIFDQLIDKHDPSGANNDYLTTTIGLSGVNFYGYLRNIQILGFGTTLAEGSLFNDRYNDWKLFTINGFKLLFREP